ncbi:RNA polymerase sigma factor [Chitinophaga cymbidii]|nr:sigma-70 family RNA polymerase sigma factor [Chitinophaga cymbidii]
MKPEDCLQKIYRAQFGKMVSALMYRSGISVIADAEDIVQEAFAAAALKWRQTLPDHPEAWLYATIRNIASKRLSRTQPHVALDQADRLTVAHASSEDGDTQLLRLLFACMHADFPPKTQLVISLRYVHGLQVQQIARLLGTSPESISKILYRQRQQVKAQDIAFHSGFVWWSEQKVGMALKVLYLVFTEGWKIGDDGGLTDEQLCEDALSLTKAVIRHSRVCGTDARALYALMLLQLARANARINENGELQELEKQPREQWDQNMIRIATTYLHSARNGPRSALLLEATIAWLHTSAGNTPWEQICGLYEQLVRVNPSPFVQLNHAVALHFAGCPDAALRQLLSLGNDTFMQNHHLYHCSLARIYTDQRQAAKALEHYRIALTCKPSLPESAFIGRKINALIQTL